MNSFYSSPFGDIDQKNMGKIRTGYVVIFIVIGVVMTIWGGMVGREYGERSRALTTEHPVQLGAWIGYTGDGEFAQGKDLTLQRVRLYYVTEQGRQAEYYEYERDGDTCRLCAYTIGRFDEQGNCFYQVSENENGGGMVQEYFLYQYDPDGRVIQQVTYIEGTIVQVADFCYPDEEATAVVVHNYQDGVLVPETSYGLVTDRNGQELLRISLDTQEPVEKEEGEESAVSRWYGSDQGGSIQYLLEVPETGEDSSGSGRTDAYLARYEYQYTTTGSLSAEYLYWWQTDQGNGRLNLQDDTVILFDGVELQRVQQGD